MSQIVVFDATKNKIYTEKSSYLKKLPLLATCILQANFPHKFFEKTTSVYGFQKSPATSLKIDYRYYYICNIGKNLEQNPKRDLNILISR